MSTSDKAIQSYADLVQRSIAKSGKVRVLVRGRQEFLDGMNAQLMPENNCLTMANGDQVMIVNLSEVQVIVGKAQK